MVGRDAEERPTIYVILSNRYIAVDMEKKSGNGKSESRKARKIWSSRDLRYAPTKKEESNM